MKILSEIKKVYHGTTTRWAKSIENGINLNKNRNPVDFGKGFYIILQQIKASSVAKHPQAPSSTLKHPQAPSSTLARVPGTTRL